MWRQVKDGGRGDNSQSTASTVAITPTNPLTLHPNLLSTTLQIWPLQAWRAHQPEQCQWSHVRTLHSGVMDPSNLFEKV